MKSPNPERLQALKAERLLPGPAVENEYLITGTFETVTPLHIGAGQYPAAGNIQLVMVESPPAGVSAGSIPGRAQDKPFEPLQGCFPFIPATSLRGAIRSFCERMLAPWGRKVASLNGDSNVQPEDVESAASDDETDDPASDIDDEKRATHLRDHLDLVSGLLGAASWQSKIRFDPARVSAEQRRWSPSGVLHRIPRVAIDHILGTAEDSKLFETEVVRPGAKFDVRIRARNVRDWELGLLLVALESFNHTSFPTRLGGSTQQGLGELRWTPARIESLMHAEENALDAFIREVQARRRGQDTVGQVVDVNAVIHALDGVLASLNE